MQYKSHHICVLFMLPRLKATGPFPPAQLKFEDDDEWY